MNFDCSIKCEFRKKIIDLKMAERTGFEPVEERLAPHRFSKPAHSTTLPSLLIHNKHTRDFKLAGGEKPFLNKSPIEIIQCFKLHALPKTILN